MLVVNEEVDLVNRSKKDCLIFKVDFQKAYLSVSRSFLEYMMVRFGHCKKWKVWINACIFVGNLSVLVNGCPTINCQLKKALNKGTHHLFIFLLIAEGLRALIKKAVSLGYFKGFKVGNLDIVVSHLQYADGTLLIGEICVENLRCMKSILISYGSYILRA